MIKWIYRSIKSRASGVHSVKIGVLSSVTVLVKGNMMHEAENLGPKCCVDAEANREHLVLAVLSEDPRFQLIDFVVRHRLAHQDSLQRALPEQITR